MTEPVTDSIDTEAQQKARRDEIFMHHLKLQRESKPLLGAQVGGKEFLHRLLEAMKGEKGVHAETLLCALASVAGYACQAAIRAECAEKGINEKSIFKLITTVDGQQYFFGDQLNAPLAENQYSIWSLSAAIASDQGLGSLIDVSEIFRHVAGSVGTPQFGIPRLPADHQPGDLPINFVRSLWPAGLALAQKFCAKPNEWPVMFGLAIQEGMQYCKDVLDPKLALTIVMESAIPMSKIDLHAKSAAPIADAQTTKTAWPVWLRSHEAKVACGGALVHTCIAIFGPLGLGYVQLPFIFALTALSVPLLLLMFAYQSGVFRKTYRGSLLDKVSLWGLALMPVLLHVYNLLKSKM